MSSRISDKKELFVFLCLIITFTILYVVGLLLPKPEISISVLLVLSAGFFAYSTLVTYKFYTGLLSKMYKMLLLASLSIFFIEASFLTGHILLVPFEVMAIILIPVNMIFAFSVLMYFKYTFEFWISPLDNTKVFYQIVIGCSILAVIILFSGLTLGLKFFAIRYALFFVFSFGILLMIYYLVKKIKGGRMGASWRFLLAAISLYALRNMLYTIVFLLNNQNFLNTTEILSMFSYLHAGYGILKQKF